MSAETAALLAEVAQLRAELAEVRDELESLDRGVLAIGGTADLALARANALAAVMAGPAETAGRREQMHLIQGGAS